MNSNLSDMITLKQAKRIVIKIGTKIIVDPKLKYKRMKSLVRQIAKLKELGHQVVLVSSGAIGVGLTPLGLRSRPQLLDQLQMCASVGQLYLMMYYYKYFSQYGCIISQSLLTHEDFDDRTRHLNARNALLCTLESGVIPIINENDAVSVAEIQFGDNDRLAALVSILIDADLLILLTSPDGLHKLVDKSKSKSKPKPKPKPNNYWERVSFVNKVDAEIMSYVGDDKLSGKLLDKSSCKLSTGGMKSKLEAVKLVTEDNINAIIASGVMPNVLDKLYEQADIGTKFAAKDLSVLSVLDKGDLNLAAKMMSYKKEKATKRWLRHFRKPKGGLIVDEGASNALMTRGKSLLPVGIVSYTGVFKVGDLVTIAVANNKNKKNPNKIIAQGLVEYSSDEMQNVIGKNKQQILTQAGEAGFRVAVHRDNLVLTER